MNRIGYEKAGKKCTLIPELDPVRFAVVTKGFLNSDIFLMTS